jgi:pimeloyl-ACP methyl ester carboxylesterase
MTENANAVETPEENYYVVEQELRDSLKEKLAALRQDGSLRRFSPETTRELYIDVDDGQIRVLHHRPHPSRAARPIVFIPGWGTVLEGFTGFFNLMSGRAECYYVETREKNSSRLDRGTARLDMDQKAKDIARALESLGLNEQDDFLLVSTCWGSAVVAHGLIEGILKAPTVLLFDPMHTLWFPRWILRHVSPVTPVLFWRMVRPLARMIALAGMKEESQRARACLFIDSADIWKWKKSAEAVREFELYGRLHAIPQEVLVFNGVRDKIHDQAHYPRIAAEIPKGRFFHMPVDESEREELIALTALEFAAVSHKDPVPDAVSIYEKPVKRRP